MPQHYEWRPRFWTTAAACAGIAATLALGNWQLSRAEYKDDLQARWNELARAPVVRLTGGVDLRDVLLRRVEVRGTFAAKHLVYIDNRIHAHTAGYHVVMPLRIAGTEDHVLVNRGWISAGRDRARPPAVETPDGEVTINGTAVAPSERFVELSPKVAEGNVWQNLVLERYRQATGLRLLPVIVQQEGGPADGLVRDWAPPNLGRNTHLAYAFQWFALSLAILVYYLVTHVRRKSQQD